MTNLEQAAQQALEALDCIYSPLYEKEFNKVRSAMSALRQALKQKPVDEPVANVAIREGLPTLLNDRDIKPTDERLYTRPQPAAPAIPKATGGTA